MTEVETVELGDPRFEETGRVNGIADDYRRLPFVRLHTDEEANRVPVAPHNCGGSVLHFADLHLGATVPNLTVMASVRGRYDGWHRDLVTTPAGADDGELLVPDGPGSGQLAEEVLDAEGSPVASPAPVPSATVLALASVGEPCR